MRLLTLALPSPVASAWQPISSHVPLRPAWGQSASVHCGSRCGLLCRGACPLGVVMQIDSADCQQLSRFGIALPASRSIPIGLLRQAGDRSSYHVRCVSMFRRPLRRGTSRQSPATMPRPLPAACTLPFATIPTPSPLAMPNRTESNKHSAYRPCSIA